MNKNRNQSGLALLLFLVVMMGLGGTALIGYTQSLKKQTDVYRLKKNKQVLEKAKQALLLHAYRYPEFTLGVTGPGRLPCPDTDNDGLVGAGVDAAQCDLVGRFPFGEPDLNTYELLDATGERLWYAVSEEFRITAPTDAILNSNSGIAQQNITIIGQGGSVMYDGALDGIAAIIFAPGAPIARDEDNNGTYEYGQVRGTLAQINDPRNYLDTWDGFDNAVFNNGASGTDDDGFILGPIHENDPASSSVNTVVVNDQAIILRTEEIIEMAQKATLEAYRTAINQYSGNTDPGATGLNQYPWLDPYESADGLGTYDAVVTSAAPNPVIGRLPSHFTGFPSPDAVPISSDMRLFISITNFPIETRVPFSNAISFTAGSLTSSFNSGDSFTGHIFDDGGTWKSCPYVTGSANDCNQDVPGNFIGGGASPLVMDVRAVTITFDNGIDPFVFQTGYDTGLITYTPPSASSNAYVSSQYDNNVEITNVTWSENEDYSGGLFEEMPVGNNSIAVFGGGDTITVGLRYYPVLPQWVLDNQWHNTIMMAYSSAVQPGGDGVCDVGVDDCLILQNPRGQTGGSLAFLFQSGADNDGVVDGLVDETGLPNYVSDDLGDIFEGENITLPADALAARLTFDGQAGNDVVMGVQ